MPHLCIKFPAFFIQGMRLLLFLCQHTFLTCYLVWIHTISSVFITCFSSSCFLFLIYAPTRAETKALIGGVYIHIFTFLKSVVITIDFKRNSSRRTRIYEYAPPPINALVSALAPTLYRGIVTTIFGDSSFTSSCK